MRIITGVILPFALAAALSACVSTAAERPNADEFELRDPIQSFNEATFSFNLGADEYVIKPVAETYHELPDWTRVGVSNFMTNLSEPANFVNGVLQGDPEIAFTSLWRFLLNTTAGVGGVFDVAAKNGLVYQNQNFGKTLGVYGLDNGAYVVLPLAGPSTVRDTAGQVVDWFLDPVGWYMDTPESVAQVVVDGIVTRDEDMVIINQYFYESLDPYAATRAAYLQHQAFDK